MKFEIKQADNALQPKLDPNVMQFNEINDDCLRKIASYLDLIDIVNLGKTSSRLGSFTALIYQKRTVFSFGTNTGDSSINEENVPTILQEMGRYITSVEWERLTEAQLHNLSEYCKNVVALNLVRPSGRLHYPQVKKYKTFFKNIETLKIDDASFFDTSMRSITALSKLKSLQLKRCHNIAGTFFTKWKKSQLRYLKIEDCRGVRSENVVDFQRTHQLIQYSSDLYNSFLSCLGSPPEILANYTELQLALNSSVKAEKLAPLNFHALQQLRKIHLTCKGSWPPQYNLDNVFAAMSQIHTLKSLIVEGILIDANTVNCLGLLTNLRKVTLNEIKNNIGRQFYSSVPVHLPNITKLSISMQNVPDLDLQDLQSICSMISSLAHLKYFSHSSMSWELLQMIQQMKLLRKQRPLEIGISRRLFDYTIKVSELYISVELTTSGSSFFF